MWVSEVQYLKGAAMFAVLAAHTTIYYRFLETVNQLVLAATVVDVFVHFAVPLFVFASGLVLALNYSGSFSAMKFYKRRAAVLIPPYLMFSTLYLAYEWWATGEAPTAIRIVFDYLTGNAYYHLWFIPLIAQLYLLYPFLLKTIGRYLSAPKAWQVAVAALALQSLFNAAILWYGPIANSALGTNLARRFFLGYVAYFVVGMYVGRNLDAIRGWAATLPAMPLAGVGLAVTGAVSAIWFRNNELFGGAYAIHRENLVLTAFLNPILYLSVFLVLLKWSLSAGSRVVRTFGDYSLWVYLFHPILIVLEIQALASFGIDYSSWLFYPLVFGTTCALCWVSTFLLARVPHNSLVGGPRNTPYRTPFHG